MLASFRRFFSYKIFPICWTVLIIVLLCLPGSMVPGNGIFSIPNFDKLVHVCLFGGHVLFWGWHYAQTISDPARYRQAVIMNMLLTALLGIALEYVQKYWIPNRTFDGYDIIADCVGATAAGLWLLRKGFRRSPRL